VCTASIPLAELAGNGVLGTSGGSERIVGIPDKGHCRLAFSVWRVTRSELRPRRLGRCTIRRQTVRVDVVRGSKSVIRE
jgi:hypothetical protein